MKKLFFSLAVVALSSTGIAFAQTKALQITKDVINVNKPIKGSPVVFELSYCDLTIANGGPSGPIVGPFEPVNPLSVSESPAASSGFYPQGAYGSIYPSITDFMDLGSKDKYFRYSYIKQPYNKVSAQQFSDARYKENIKDLRNAASVIQLLHPVSFDFKITEPTEDTAALKNKVGFLAQEMMTVLPHSVGLLPGADIYTVDYISVIPYLVKAFQEVQAEKSELEEHVAELEEQLASLQEIVQSLLVQNESAPKGKAPKNSPQKGIKEAKLFQNLPNPFSQITVIRYELPKTAGNAYLQVFDMAGIMLKNLPLPAVQEIGQVEISAGELLPGTYTYSLIVSGKVIDSKRMVVTR